MKLQKQLSKCVLKKSYFENMQQIYRRTLMPKLFNQPTTLSYFDASSILFHDSPIWNSRFKLTNPVGHTVSAVIVTVAVLYMDVNI